jgi:hypothetical protein
MQLRRRAVPVLVAVALTAAALLAGISSAPATPTASVAGLQTASWVAVPGSRRLTLIDHPASSAAGRVACTVSAQKTSDGVFLRFRYACVEYRGAIRLRDYYRLAKAWLGRWVVLWLNGTDVVAAQTPIARFTVYSPALRLCQVNPALVWWQGEHQTAVRWKVPSTLVTIKKMWSEKFQERLLARDARCVAPPPPPSSTTTTTTAPPPTVDLTVRKDAVDTADPGITAPDDNFVYVVTVDHTGAATAAATTAVDTWPVGLDAPADADLTAAGVQVDADATVAGFQDRGCVYDPAARRITCALGAVSADVVLRFAARTNGDAVTAGELVNTATVATTSTETNAANNSATLRTPIVA